MSKHSLIVTGSRSTHSLNVAQVQTCLHSYVDSLPEGSIFQVFVGCARGVDKVVRDFFEDYSGNPKATVHVFTANWEKHGKSAGSRRNIAMLTLAEARQEAFPQTETTVLAFPGPTSRGTFHCMKEAEKRGFKVTQINLV